jgi:arylsulfatase A-like enzyme
VSDADKWSHRRIEDPNEFKFSKDGPWRGGEDQPQCGFTDKWVGGWTQFRQHLRDAGLGELLDKNPRLGNHNMGTSGPEGTHIHSLVPEEHHEAAFSCGEAEKFIRLERDRNKPFCMVVSIYGPHSPVAPPQPWDSLYSAKDVPLPENFRDKLINKPYGQRRNAQCYRLRNWTEEQFRDYIARYWGYCAYIDSRIGRVLKALDDTGEMDNTIIVFTADHGDMVAAHGMILKLGSCGYDELMRVPCLIRYPRAIKGGLVSDALIESADVFPTLLALSGAPIPKTVQGRSFEDILRGRARDFRDVVHSDWVNSGFIVRTKDWKYVNNWKQGDLDELYDMNARPLEMSNLAAEPAQAEKVKEMKSLIVAWLEETKHPYAGPMEKAVMSDRSDKPLLEPRVAAFHQGQDKDGKTTADFEITWKVVRPLPADSKYWCFIHVVPPQSPRARKGDGILTRATKWPEVPAGQWKAGTDYSMGTMAVPIPADMKPGLYDVRTGLYNPEKKENPQMLGGPTMPIGQLRIERGKDGKTVVKFQPIE